ncbi:NAD(P)/FAD-dependent oxidoreductase [Mangrovicoccus ximenensis]|uniref:NAD(P)/FAD-dependent oxidoreductase n=1 Tax=Mangrovicoccus ximenensis TaxID=1911570 RepID=UPI002ED359C0
MTRPGSIPTGRPRSADQGGEGACPLPGPLPVPSRSGGLTLHRAARMAPASDRSAAMPRVPYEAAAYGAGSLEGCYWATTCDAPDCPPLEGDATAEVAVIGAGFTGLSAALHLARAGMEVAVFDRHGPGWGASGRNGGFACIGGRHGTGRAGPRHR